MKLDSSWAMILSIISLLYAMFISRRSVLIQDSYEVTQTIFASAFTGSYYYFGRNLDSYVLLFKMFIKFGILTIVYAGVCSLFIYLGSFYFTIPFSIVYIGSIIRLCEVTRCKIQKVNPDFKQVSVEVYMSVSLVSCSFVSYLLIMVYVPDFKTRMIGAILLILVCLTCYVVPVTYYYCEIIKNIEYRVKMHGDVDELFLFRFETVNGKVWELNKNFIFLVIRDSGDYNVILSDKECKLFKKSEIAVAGYFVKREENYGIRSI